MPGPTIEQLTRDLSAATRELELTSRMRDDLSKRADSLAASLNEAQAAKIKAEAAAENLRQQLAAQGASLKQSQDELTKARESLRNQEGELGRLRAVSQTVDGLRLERDNYQNQLIQLKADVERQVGDAVKNALAQMTQQHQEERQNWEKERQDFLQNIADLKERLETTGIKAHVFPADLAARFAKVLDELAEGKPVPGRQYAAALTSLEVEARGMLEAPREGEDQPRFVTVEAAGKVDPGTLSTLKMSFRLLPRVSPENA